MSEKVLDSNNMRDAPELARCPFCGGVPFIHHYRSGDYVHIECGSDDCPMQCVSATGATEELATSAWQERRASSPAAGWDAVMESLKKALQEIADTPPGRPTAQRALRVDKHVAIAKRALKETPNGN